MEQIGFFLTEYSDWIIVSMGMLVTMLLTVALHRIKKLGKRLDILASNARSQWESCIGLDEKERLGNRIVEEKTDIKKGEQKRADMGKTAGWQKTIEVSDDGALGKMDSDELLNAVLDEVFYSIPYGK